MIQYVMTMMYHMGLGLGLGLNEYHQHWVCLLSDGNLAPFVEEAWEEDVNLTY